MPEIIEGESCVSAWFTAVTSIEEIRGHEADNVLLEVESPSTDAETDSAIFHVLDMFLREHGAYPIGTVANTIFPHGLYKRYGAPDFYEVYLNHVYPRIASGNQWGRYFARMTSRTMDDGTEFNPLQVLIQQMDRHVNGTGPSFRHAYEMALSDPTLDLPVYRPDKDQRRTRNRQCMSFISFKLTPDARVSLTAVYRNHYYIQRLLGNLIGLRNLLSFVSEQVGRPVGRLTVLSTHATVEAGGDVAWRRRDIAGLLKDCREAAAENLAYGT